MAEDSTSPSSVAWDVHQALQFGKSLPRLYKSEELAQELLTFHPSNSQTTSHASRNKDTNRTEARDTSLGEPESERKGFGFSPSVLMLEAFSRKRLDAVQQLHDACPQLLASIPLFDVTPRCTACPSTSQTSCFQLFLNQFRGRSSFSPVFHVPSHHLFHNQTTCLSDHPSTSQTPHVSDFHTEVSGPHSSFWETSVHICPHKRTSALLDLAAEMQSLLVFVLQNHPEVCLQPGCVEGHHQRNKPHAMNTLNQSKVCSDTNTLAALHKSSAPGAESPNPVQGRNNANDNGEESFSEELSSNEDDDQEDENLLMDSNITSTVNICIHKNNPEVLQYLLYRYVWNNFLPYNSDIAGYSCDDPVPPCSWFLHCAALTGCPRLLSLVLCGKFSHQCTPVSPSPHTSNAFSTKSASNLDSETTNKGQSKSLTDTDRDLNSRSDQKCNQAYVTKDSPGHGSLCVISHTTDTDTAPSSRPQQAAVLADCPAIGSETRLHSNSDTEDGNVTHTAMVERKVGQGESSNSQQEPISQLSLSNTSRASNPTASNSTQSVPGFHIHNAQERSTASITSIPSKPSQSSGTCFQNDRDTYSGGHEESPSCSRPVTMEHQQQSSYLTVLDPNNLLPAFLPVKDHFIPTGTHVRLAPLHLACWRCDPASIQVLLDHGADVNQFTEQLECSAAVTGEKNSVETMDSGLSSAGSDSSLPPIRDSSSSDLSEALDGLESVMQRAGPRRERCALSPLTALVLGIRSQPRFSLHRGKSLGLVAPSLPEQRNRHTDRGEDPAKRDALEALRLLLEAGCDVNAHSLVFGKVVRAVDLLVHPSGDVHSTTYLGSHTILLCTALERVANTVLGVSWELLMHGGRPGFSFSDSTQWNLPRMDWVRLNNETLRERFLHLAIFLGLFPPLDPAVALRSNAPELAGNAGADFFGRDKPRVFAWPSSAHTDLRQTRLSSSSLSDGRPSCIPWTPYPSRIASSSSSFQSYSTQSDSEEEDQAMTTGNTNQDSRTEELPDTVAAPPQPVESQAEPSDADSIHSPAFSHPSSRSGSDGTSSSESHGRNQNPVNILTSPNHQRSDVQRKPVLSSSCYNLDTSMIDFWTQRNHQQRCLKKFVDDVLEMSVTPSCQTLILRFLCLSDLHQLATITKRKLRGVSDQSDSPLQALSHAVSQAAQPRTLKHSCKLAVLWAVSWSPAHVHGLPLPAHVQRYLLSPD